MSGRPSRSTSPSDGEIVESELEKANTKTIASSSMFIDPHPRDHASSIASATSRRPINGFAPSYPSRDRSRSPYRKPRGVKRQGDTDLYQRTSHPSRRFKVYYEGREKGQAHRRRSWSPQDEQLATNSGGLVTKESQPLSPYGMHQNVEEGLGVQNKTLPNQHLQRDDPSKDTQHHASNRHVNSQFMRNYRPGIQRHLPNSKSREIYQIDEHERRMAKSDIETIVSPGKELAIYNAHSNLTYIDSNADPTNDVQTTHDAATMDFNAVEDTPKDENLLIEERRKRREAIMAKHRDSSANPNGQASDNGDRMSLSPLPSATSFSALMLNVSSSSVKADVVQPPQNANAQFDHAAGTSPGFDDKLAMIGSFHQGDGPSAADYDPTMDAQETKIRNTFSPPSTVLAQQSSQIAEHARHDPLPFSTTVDQKLAEEFDMFADGEATTLSAQKVLQASRSECPMLETQVSSKTQAVDMLMLDDSDDVDGYYKVKLGELLDRRYHVQSNLGQGMFSGVVRALEQGSGQILAIKIVRNNDSMYKAGLKEISILQNLRAADPDDRKHLIRLERHFEHKGHLCMVFENLNINLREVLKKFGRDVGINIKAVRIYAQQMFLALGLLRKCNILHADLKPDNILVNESRNLLKICDLGSAADASETEITQYLVSRFYRAPEIILGCPYDFSIDMWSVGCTLFELYTGKILFTGRTNNQMLKAVMECRGKLGQRLLRRGQYTSMHFDNLLNFRSVEKDRISGKDVVRLMNITKPSKDLRSRLLPSSKGLSDVEVKEVHLFADLLDRCLSLNPEKRCTPQEALRHPFITKQKAFVE